MRHASNLSPQHEHFLKLSIFGAVFVLAALAIVIDSLIPGHSFYLPEPKPQNAQSFFSLYFARLA
jgi:hypothetical protein